jgi:RNA polymerase sigma-70 factor (ECF subfamily)
LREDAVLRMPPQPSVIGAAAVVRFFREKAARGDLSRMRLTPARANGRPAVVAQRRTPDGGLAPHGVLVLEISTGAVVGIDAFIDPALVPRFMRRRT